MFFEQPKARTQDFVARSLECQLRPNYKYRFFEERTFTGNHSPYKKRISFNFFSKTKISRTHETNHR